MNAVIANRELRTTLALVGMLALMTCISGCATPWQKKWPTHETQVVDLPAPSPTLAPLSIDREWWTVFGDPTLNGLVADALVNNLDLAKAAANVAEARANAGAAKAMLSPRADAVGKASATRRQLSVVGEDLNHTTTFATGGVGVSWEIDLWGRIRQLNEASLARLAASEHTRNATVLSISSAVVETYFQLLALDANLRITQDAERNLSEVADLERRRWEADVGTELAYSQSLAEFASVKTRIPSIEAAIVRTQLALAILVGRTPRQMTAPLARSGALPSLPDIPSEFDSTLLLRRPDVASAEQMLAAANADVNAARAERLPRLNLALLAGLIASSSSAISGFPLYADLSSGVSAPIYDAGLLQSKVEAAVARKDKAIAHYRYTVALAFRDVYAAMIDRDAGDRQVGAAVKVVKIRKQALKLTEKSYEAGRSSKFEVLSETIDILNAQTALTDARLNQFIASSEFFKAIGGGF
ncbi:efflux transporter outer membrane subunit [Pseudomonas sp. LS1212]|uniref:efflux transporter outer membrane subunit n=1 Tax=Pseudomonas sp. LS1212 TaxID=2972478 RepID=UPI00215CCB56|nr:efflux transporter outer membrane subunit [Pseudomonas sp. LS1212]UVJ43623.1 efflux transporter outer membrane subunit [Pseudomonas sp. LS1212]